MSNGKVKKILKIGVEAVVGVALVALFVVFLLTKSTGKLLFVGGKTTMWVMTESMSPTISPKTYILVEKVTADEVQEGDIIVFISTDPNISGQYNTHRVIRREGNTFVTKGDNNPVSDGIYSAKAENIVARYVKTLPVMTFLGRMMLSTAGFAVVMVLFVLTTVLCVVPDLRNAVKAKEQEDKEREMERLVREEVARLEREGASAEDLQPVRHAEDAPPPAVPPDTMDDE